MESVVFTPGEGVLIICCSDGRTIPPVIGVDPGQLHPIRRPGGVLAPWVGAGDDSHMLALLQKNFLEEAILMVELKKPVAVVVVSHADCGAAKSLRADDPTVQRRLVEFVEVLRESLVRREIAIPIYAAHDDHCAHGHRRAFRQVHVAGGQPLLVASAA